MVATEFFMALQHGFGWTDYAKDVPNIMFLHFQPHLNPEACKNSHSYKLCVDYIILVNINLIRELASML
jgi:hypothetical protein